MLTEKYINDFSVVKSWHLIKFFKIKFAFWVPILGKIKLILYSLLARKLMYSFQTYFSLTICYKKILLLSTCYQGLLLILMLIPVL